MAQEKVPSPVDDLLGGDEDQAASMVGDVEAQNTVDLNASDFPELEGKKPGDQVSVTVSGIVKASQDGMVSIEMTPAEAAPEGSPADAGAAMQPELTE